VEKKEEKTTGITGRPKVLKGGLIGVGEGDGKKPQKSLHITDVPAKIKARRRAVEWISKNSANKTIKKGVGKGGTIKSFSKTLNARCSLQFAFGCSRFSMHL